MIHVLASVIVAYPGWGIGSVKLTQYPPSPRRKRAMPCTTPDVKHSRRTHTGWKQVDRLDCCQRP